MDRNHERPINAKILIDEMMKRWERGEPDTEMQDMEREFRRGWHLGWSYACDIILDELLSKGISFKDTYRLVALFEADKVMEWRRVISPLGTPVFQIEDYQKKDEEQV